MENEISKINENISEQTVNEYRGEIAFEQRIDSMADRRKEENETIKEQAINLGEDNNINNKGVIGKFREMATRNKLLRGAVIAGAILTVEPAFGQVVTNNNQIESAMMNFAFGLRKSPQRAEEKFVQGINNPHNTESNTTKHSENKKLAIPEKGTADYFIWKLSPENEKEKVLKNYRERLKKKHDQEDDKLDKDNNSRKSASADGKINLKKRSMGRLKPNAREHFNFKNNQRSRIIRTNEEPRLQMKTQELQQDLLQNNYNFPKANINISPDANIDNVNVNSGARVEIGPNAQVGDIEAKEGADVQIGTTRY